MGFTNVIGKLSNVAAPMVAEQDPPIPMIACISFAICAFIMCLMLETQEEALKKKEILETEMN